jgi:hypothetical protein
MISSTQCPREILVVHDRRIALGVKSRRKNPGHLKYINTKRRRPAGITSGRKKLHQSRFYSRKVLYGNLPAFGQSIPQIGRTEDSIEEEYLLVDHVRVFIAQAKRSKPVYRSAADWPAGASAGGVASLSEVCAAAAAESASSDGAGLLVVLCGW